MKAKRLLFLVMAICLASGVKAQIYNSEVLFYVEEGSKLTNSSTSTRIIRIKDGMLYTVSRIDNLKTVCNKLKNDINYYENHPKEWVSRNKPGSLSNTKWMVTSICFDALYDFDTGAMLFPQHCIFKAIATDLSKYMEWSEPEYDDPNGVHMGRRTTFKRITKSELLKLSFSTRDFLK